jgi:hypothetical protein
MPNKRRKPPFWRRGNPGRQYDIAMLRPRDGPKGERFETVQDARAESERSEQLLKSFSGGSRELAEFLQECRDGDYECNHPFCPICARKFRRWFIGELLRVTKGNDAVRIYTVLLEEAPRDKINSLAPTPFRHFLRKRLERAGLGKVPVIGGFEIVYKAKGRVWVLHVNLVVIGGKKSAHKEFKRSFKKSRIKRPIIRAKLKDPPEQLSYILKFGTYHRPHEQHGPSRSDAKPLNPREHTALMKWMSQFEFNDVLFLVNAKRRGGSKITVRDQPND